MTNGAAHDEMVDGQGGVRPHWRAMLGSFHGLGGNGLQERALRLDRLLEEEGVGGVLPGALPHTKPWRCDPVPLLLQAGEFFHLEAGLAQRARLLSSVLDDLYGKQSLLRRGILPAVGVYASPGFLRPCRIADETTPNAPHLQLYAADLIRDAAGEWRVLADRTSVIDGLGMARENRRVLGQVFPEGFRAQQVWHQRGFFDVWASAIARGRVLNPTVALLTPGIGDARWFEHVVLSRELSCTLVEGGDLAVRGGRLFLKTLQGLQPIDVLVRQVEGRLLDPLELDGSAASGMPGLLDAARAGDVAILNGPGSGVASMPMLAAFMPRLADALFGEALQLKGIGSVWLGDPQALRAVEADASQWIFRAAADEFAAPVTAANLAEPESFLDDVRRHPWAWVASPRSMFGTIPCVGPDRLEPRAFVLRMFLVFDGTEWRAMRGGLARVCEMEAALAPALTQAGLTKDVWVLAEDRGDLFGASVAATPPVALRRATGDLPSRVADNLFWLGRYVERLERAARLLRAAAGRVIHAEAMSPRQSAGLKVLAGCLAESGLIPGEAASAVTLGEALLAALRPRQESGEGGSVPRMFAEISRLTESVRDRLTDDMYATFTQTLAQARGEAETVGRRLDRLGAAMVGIQRFCTAVSGVAAENMVRGGGFLFLDMGRRLERAHAVATEVAAALDQPRGQIEVGLSLILELCDSAITYRSRYLSVLQPAPVLDLVLVDQGNPRGLAFQLVAMHDHLDELNPTGFGRETLAGAVAGLVAQVEAMVASVLDAREQAAAAVGLPAPLRDVAGEISGLSNRIVRRYFALLPAVQTMGWGGDLALSA